MIAWVEGVLRVRTPTRVVVDVNGVGYELLVPLSTFGTLPDEGKTVSLHVHTIAREDALQLFGFATGAEHAAFGLLLKASRVGPRLAQSILSGIAPEALVGAIEQGDVKALRAVPGIGAKMAERIIVELRDRVSDWNELWPLAAAAADAATGEGDRLAEAVSALVNLGYPRGRAEKAVERAAGSEATDVRVEDLIRSALRSLGSST